MKKKWKLPSLTDNDENSDAEMSDGNFPRSQSLRYWTLPPSQRMERRKTEPLPRSSSSEKKIPTMFKREKRSSNTTFKEEMSFKDSRKSIRNTVSRLAKIRKLPQNHEGGTTERYMELQQYLGRGEPSVNPTSVSKSKNESEMPTQSLEKDYSTPSHIENQVQVQGNPSTDATPGDTIQSSLSERKNSSEELRNHQQDSNLKVAPSRSPSHNSSAEEDFDDSNSALAYGVLEEKGGSWWEDSAGEEGTGHENDKESNNILEPLVNYDFSPEPTPALLEQIYPELSNDTITADGAPSFLFPIQEGEPIADGSIDVSRESYCSIGNSEEELVFGNGAILPHPDFINVKEEDIYIEPFPLAAQTIPEGKPVDYPHSVSSYEEVLSVSKVASMDHGNSPDKEEPQEGKVDKSDLDPQSTDEGEGANLFQKSDGEGIHQIPSGTLHHSSEETNVLLFSSKEALKTDTQTQGGDSNSRGSSEDFSQTSYSLDAALDFNGLKQSLEEKASSPSAVVDAKDFFSPESIQHLSRVMSNEESQPHEDPIGDNSHADQQKEVDDLSGQNVTSDKLQPLDLRRHPSRNSSRSSAISPVDTNSINTSDLELLAEQARQSFFPLQEEKWGHYKLHTNPREDMVEPNGNLEPLTNTMESPRSQSSPTVEDEPLAIPVKDASTFSCEDFMPASSCGDNKSQGSEVISRSKLSSITHGSFEQNVEDSDDQKPEDAAVRSKESSEDLCKSQKVEYFIGPRPKDAGSRRCAFPMNERTQEVSSLTNDSYIKKEECVVEPVPKDVESPKHTFPDFLNDSSTKEVPSQKYGCYGQIDGDVVELRKKELSSITFGSYDPKVEDAEQKCEEFAVQEPLSMDLLNQRSKISSITNNGSYEQRVEDLVEQTPKEQSSASPDLSKQSSQSSHGKGQSPGQSPRADEDIQQTGENTADDERESLVPVPPTQTDIERSDLALKKACENRGQGMRMPGTPTPITQNHHNGVEVQVQVEIEIDDHGNATSRNSPMLYVSPICSPLDTKESQLKYAPLPVFEVETSEKGDAICPPKDESLTKQPSVASADTFPAQHQSSAYSSSLKEPSSYSEEAIETRPSISTQKLRDQNLSGNAQMKNLPGSPILIPTAVQESEEEAMSGKSHLDSQIFENSQDSFPFPEKRQRKKQMPTAEEKARQQLAKLKIENEKENAFLHELYDRSIRLDKMGDWLKLVDPQTMKVFYSHASTREIKWTLPPENDSIFIEPSYKSPPQKTRDWIKDLVQFSVFPSQSNTIDLEATDLHSLEGSETSSTRWGLFSGDPIRLLHRHKPNPALIYRFEKSRGVPDARHSTDLTSDFGELTGWETKVGEDVQESDASSTLSLSSTAVPSISALRFLLDSLQEHPTKAHKKRSPKTRMSLSRNQQKKDHTPALKPTALERERFITPPGGWKEVLQCFGPYKSKSETELEAVQAQRRCMKAKKNIGRIVKKQHSARVRTYEFSVKRDALQEVRDALRADLELKLYEHGRITIDQIFDILNFQKRFHGFHEVKPRKRRHAEYLKTLTTSSGSLVSPTYGPWKSSTGQRKPLLRQNFSGYQSKILNQEEEEMIEERKSFISKLKLQASPTEKQTERERSREKATQCFELLENLRAESQNMTEVLKLVLFYTKEQLYDHAAETLRYALRLVHGRRRIHKIMTLDDVCFILVSLSHISILCRDFADANDYARAALDLCPSNKYVLMEVGRVFESLGDFKTAEQLYLACLLKEPSCYKTCVVYAEFKANQGDFDVADRYFGRALILCSDIEDEIKIKIKYAEFKLDKVGRPLDGDRSFLDVASTLITAEIEGDLRSVYAKLGRWALMRRQDFSRAREYLERALSYVQEESDGTEFPSATLHLAIALATSKKAAEKRRADKLLHSLLSSVCSKHFHSAEVTSYLFLIYAHFANHILEQHEVAGLAYSKACEMSHLSPIPAIAYAQWLEFQDDDVAAARKVYNSMMKPYQQDIRLLVAAGHFYLTHRHIHKAKDCIHKAIQLSGSSSASALRVISFLKEKQGDDTAAFSYVQSAVSALRDPLTLRSLAVSCYLFQNDPIKATALLEEALTIDPNDVDTLVALAFIKLESSKESEKEAEQLLLKAGGLEEPGVNILRTLAHLYHIQGDHSRSNQYFKDACRFLPVDPLTMVRYAQFLSGSEKTLQYSKKFFEAAMELPDLHPECYLLYAIYLERHERSSQQAFEYLRRCTQIKSTPALASALYLIGRHVETYSSVKESEKWYVWALDCNPSSSNTIAAYCQVLAQVDEDYKASRKRLRETVIAMRKGRERQTKKYVTKLYKSAKLHEQLHYYAKLRKKIFKDKFKRVNQVHWALLLTPEWEEDHLKRKLQGRESWMSIILNHPAAKPAIHRKSGDTYQTPWQFNNYSSKVLPHNK